MIIKEDIEKAFSKKDRKHLWIPEELLNNESVLARPFFGWVHRSGHMAFMFRNGFQDNKNKGIAFSLGPLKDSRRVCMCDWCLSVYPVSRIAQFSHQQTKTKSVGFYACDQLDCVDRILSPDTNNVHSMRETLTRDQKIQRYYERVSSFYNANL